MRERKIGSLTGRALLLARSMVCRHAVNRLSHFPQYSLTFARGALLDDPEGLFNSSLEGRARRAIDFRESDKVDEKALKTLIRAAWP